MTNASSLGDALLARQLQYASPATIPYVKRSAYLADALQQLSEHGGENIRNPLALGANLLAEGLLQFGSDRADKKLAARSQQDLSDRVALDASQLQLPDTGTATPSPVSGPQPSPPAGPLQVATGPTVRPPDSVTPAPPRFTSDHPMVDALATAKGQPLPPTAQPTEADFDAMRHLPAAEYMRPENQARMGQMVAATMPGSNPNQGLPYPVRAPQPAQSAPMGAGSEGPPLQPQLQPQGPAAPGGSGGSSPFALGAPAAPGPGGSASPPQGGASYQGAPTLPIQPYQRERLNQLKALALKSPAYLPQFEAYVQELRHQQTTPVDPDKHVWNPQTKAYEPQPGMGFADVAGGAPNAKWQRGPDGKLYATPDPAYGPVPAGTAMGPGGQIAPVPGGGFRDVPGPPNAYVQRGPNNEVKVTGNPAYGSVPEGMSMGRDGAASQVPGAISATTRKGLYTDFVGSKAYEGYTEAKLARDALQNLAQHKGGPITFAEFDNFVRGSNPGGIARQQMLDMVEHLSGVSNQVKMELTRWVSQDGVQLSKPTLDAMTTAMGDMTNARYGALRPQIDWSRSFAKKNGFDAEEIMPPVEEPAHGSGASNGFEAQYAKLPPGARYQAPDGSWRVKGQH